MEARTFSQSPALRPRAGWTTWRAFKRWLYWFHRWLGVVTCLLCVMWFLSGLVMLYVPFPSWSDQERIASLPAVDIERIRVSPDEALRASGIGGLPATFRLEMLGGEPVYRIANGDARASLSAATGKIIGGVTKERAAQHVSAVFPNDRPTFAYAVDADQWTPTKRFDPHRPLYRFALNDAADTVVYVSSQSGEIVQNATLSERAWNWVGAVPHWIYFTPIRRDQELWRQMVMWLSGPLVIGAISGVWIGILRLRAKAPKAGRSVSPYRGWMKWHHLAGLIGGIFLTTWIFSGWLSVNPFKWFARTQLTETQLAAYAGWTPGTQVGAAARAFDAVRGSSDISFFWVAGKPFMLGRGASDTRVIDAATGERAAFTETGLIEAAGHMYPAQRIVATQRLEEETIYWYSHHNERPLPVIKVAFGDPSEAWIYLDPATGAVAGLSDRSSRTYRWMFSFLHDYDLPILLRNQPARDILIWLLSLAGLVISVSGVVVGWRTLKRSIG
ncbi:MAG: PepSY domain-containing protein [Hyphomicrobiaceae bacterium]|nr:PepSY domain-containing protein [Hyphomicrobiaceae bacterium]